MSADCLTVARGGGGRGGGAPSTLELHGGSALKERSEKKQAKGSVTRRSRGDGYFAGGQRATASGMTPSAKHLTISPINKGGYTLEEGPPIWRSWYFMLLILAGRGFKKNMFLRVFSMAWARFY